MSLLSDDERAELLATLSEREAHELLYDWLFWARPDQLPPTGNWRVWLVMAGRGFGKTRIGAEWVRQRVKRFPFTNIVGATADDARDIMIEGESGILAICPDDERPTYLPSKRRLEWPNGARTLIFTADEPERLRGKQHDGLWCVAAETPVLTDHGVIPIERVRAGMQTWTRKGWRRVQFSTMTASNTSVIRIATADGDSVRLTDTHKVFTRNRGWIIARNVVPGDIMDAWSYDTDHRHGLNGKGSAGIGGKRGITPIARGHCFTSRSGSASIRSVSLMIGSFITTMKTLPTTIRRILSPCLAPITLGCTLLYATVPTPGMRITAATKRVRGHGLRGKNDNHESLRASVAGRSTNQSGCELNSAQRLVQRGTTVVSVEPSGRADVWDLTVEGAHEFYAGGVLVHNCDEVAAWRYGMEAWDQAMFGLRLGPDPQCVATTTPKPVAVVRDLLKQVADGTVVVTRGSSYANRDNLAPAFFDQIVRRYEGTRIGRQELGGELLEDVEGALWTLALIDRHRVKAVPEGVSLTRVVVGVDPPATSTGAECGIVVAALGSDKRGYVLADRSIRGTPNEWANAAIAAYDEFDADAVVIEVNQGGEMATNTLKTVRPNLPIKAVHASRGKATRAEPVSALYEQGHVSHVGSFPSLEDQMCNWVPGGTSPDRMDALVWAAIDTLVKLKPKVRLL